MTTKQISMQQTDQGFWEIMGPIFASKDIRKALGIAPASDETYLWEVCVTQDACLCGFSALVPGRKEIKHGYVFPEFRRLGIYRKLVKKHIETAKELGLSHLSATTTNDSLPLLLELGFVKIGQRGKYHSLRIEL